MPYADKVRANGTLREIHDTAVRNMIAPTETTNTASRDYAEGDYLIYTNILYRVTVPILTGNTIVPNTNCVQTIIGTQFSNISPCDSQGSDTGILIEY